MLGFSLIYNTGVDEPLDASIMASDDSFITAIPKGLASI